MENVENIERKGNNIYKTIEEFPLYFGGYLNMARHNMFILINHLTDEFKHLGYEKLREDNEIDYKNHILSSIFDLSKKDIPDTARVRVYNYLVKRHHLPFLKIFNDENIDSDPENNKYIRFEDTHTFIINSFQMINKYRNSYSHYLAIDDNKNRIIEKTKR